MLLKSSTVFKLYTLQIKTNPAQFHTVRDFLLLTALLIYC